MANVITGFRIFVSAMLLFCPVFSPVFYALYLIAGLSDMVDMSSLLHFRYQNRLGGWESEESFLRKLPRLQGNMVQKSYTFPLIHQKNLRLHIRHWDACMPRR